MPIPSPNLDDLRFQSSLVDEARKRIIHYCPEWTEYNLSDPGITLIELFAWMTELLAYRLNRVPEKNYIKFLELLGLQPHPASSAKTDLSIWFSVSLPLDEEDEQTIVIPEGLQVRTIAGDEEEIIFSTDYRKEAFSPRLTQLRKDSQFRKNFAARMGIETFHPFKEKPEQGDTFFIGFDPERDISGHILQLDVTCEPTEAVGVRRQDPPLVWECSLGNGKWFEIAPSTLPDEKDTTGGLNNPRGQLTLHLPLTAAVDNVHGQSAYWVRCRFEQRNESQGVYTESPRISRIRPTTIGTLVPATHSQVVELEMLGQSTGEPGQTFQLEYFPVLRLQENEMLEIEEHRQGQTVFVPWVPVPSFANSTHYDRHFMLDPASGMVELGPAVRQPDGTVRQYGRIPESGRTIRFRRYRYGGGASGNVPARTLQTLVTSFAYLARVNNLRRAAGGRDQESLEELKMRAQRELMAQQRAVTAPDFEQFIRNYSRTVGRVRCITAGDPGEGVRPGAVEVLVVPAVRDSLIAGDLSRLHLSQQFIKGAREYLNQYRLLTTAVQVREPQYTGVQVRASLVVDDFSVPEVVQQRVTQVLQHYLSPLPLLDEGDGLNSLFEIGWEGWQFGQGLFLAEISSLIQRVAGVRYVLDVNVYSRPVDPERERLRIDEIDPEEPVTPLKEQMLWLPDNGLICSLDHQVKIVDLDDATRQMKKGA